MQDINDKEQGSSGQAIDAAQIKEKGVWVDRLEYDDEFKLPYGVGYDTIIKKRTDMVDKQKYWNNKVMDELVSHLGYVDYRDALACNKYIMDVKRHGDYHQQARAKILSVAMAKYTAQKRQEIDHKAAAVADLPKDEAKLRVIMDQDSEMARLYREAYGDIQREKEADETEANRIHDKYAYLYDGKTLENRKPSQRYDLAAREM